MEPFHSGFVGLVGPANSGKSTLLNAFVGRKVSGVSPLPQTTYHAIRGIVRGSGFELVCIDTPGLQDFHEAIAVNLNRVAVREARACDLLLWVFDVTHPRVFEVMRSCVERWATLKSVRGHYCALNKIDRVAKPGLLPLIQSTDSLGLFSEVIPISAKTGDGVGRLLELLGRRLPNGRALYPEGTWTDRPFDFWAAEMVREKIYHFTRQEIPYSVWVQTELWTGKETIGTPMLSVVIHVDSPSRRKILIGRTGRVLKKIGIGARRDIENFLGYPICLKLHVDVESAWKNKVDRVRHYLELQ